MDLFKFFGNCQVIKSQNEEGRRWRLAQEEEQAWRRPNRLRGLAEAGAGTAQTSGRAGRLLVVDLAGPRLILQI